MREPGEQGGGTRDEGTGGAGTSEEGTWEQKSSTPLIIILLIFFLSFILKVSIII